MTRIRIPVAPPPPADYDVIVEPGVLGRLPALVKEAAPAFRYAVVADDAVAALYGAGVLDGLAAAGIRASLHTFRAGEARKTREVWARLTDALLGEGLARDGAVIALGGGVTGDLAGFIAATYMRGIPVVQVPTSLLAMVDASVGGKTGVDTPAGKNLVGAFHPPRIVIADPAVLQTLPEAEFRNGMAEAVKHGAIADARYLRWIEGAAAALLRREPRPLARLIRRSVRIKAGFVARDLREAGPRQALNFGHTIGHAIESVTDFGISHGAAVAIGMVAEAAAGESVGVTAPGAAASLRGVLQRFDLPVELPDGTAPRAVLEAARSDKKARRGHARYTLLARIGEVARTEAGEWAFRLEPGRLEGVLSALQRRTDRSFGGMC
ncbi:MAG TPA: 3-dehydroquinate synthase [Longimicrobiales bacterium]